jgi:hypothetical protein
MMALAVKFQLQSEVFKFTLMPVISLRLPTPLAQLELCHPSPGPSRRHSTLSLTQLEGVMGRTPRSKLAYWPQDYALHAWK